MKQGGLKMSNIRIALMAFTVALTFAGTASAQPSASDNARTVIATDSAAASELAEGEIRKVEKDGKKLTIKHGPLKNLDMPGMTMVFGVNDEAVLDKLQVGDKIRFQAEKIDGRIVATKIEAAR